MNTEIPFPDFHNRAYYDFTNVVRRNQVSAWHGRSILFRTTDGFDYAVCLGKKEDVPRVIEEFIEFDGSALPEVMIDPDAGVHPMVGPEISYREMITADFVPNR